MLNDPFNLTRKPQVCIKTYYPLLVKQLHPDAIIPTKKRDTDFGYDLYAIEDTELKPGAVTLVRTGLGFRFPPGMGGILKDRSGVATKLGVQTVAGVIDQEYTGEVMIPFYNSQQHSSVIINKGDKIAQMMLIPVYHSDIEVVEDLGTTDRGGQGFNSSGGINLSK